MKKTFICLIILLIPLTLLAGCGNNARPSLEDRIGEAGQNYPTSFEGVIERLKSLDVYQQGTHQLVTDGQGTLIIQSPSVDLNEYLGQKVLVKGTLEKGIGDAKDVFTVTNIFYVDDTKSAELQDYENQAFGFKFSHPSTWIVTEGQDGLSLSLEEKKVVEITVFSDESDLTAFVAGREKSQSTEVTIGAQRALRLITGTRLSFYVPNPPKEKIYLIEYTPGINSVDDKAGADAERELFYNLLDSFELIYLNQTQGEKCGGTEQIKCPDDQVCQLNSGDKDAEGVCAPIGGGQSTRTDCPFIAPPANCNQYRISEYNQKGCPSLYECIDEGAGTQASSYRDLNAVGVEEAPTGYYEEAFDEKNNKPVVDEADGISSEEKKYDVPDVSKVTAVYANARRGFSLLYPKSWYYASFGAIDGALWKVGFSNVEFEEPAAALITLSITKEPGGSAYKKIGDFYYVVDGPADLKPVMKEMADSVEESQ
jgi:hypothetical protein